VRPQGCGWLGLGRPVACSACRHDSNDRWEQQTASASLQSTGMLCCRAMFSMQTTDMLRGKLSQLEHNVLAAAAASQPGGAGAPSASTAAAAAAATAGGSTPKQGGGGALDLRALLQSLGLGEEVVRGLAEVGPQGPAAPGHEGDTDQPPLQQQQQQGQSWPQAAGGSFRWVPWCVPCSDLLSRELGRQVLRLQAC
jgi:hypothetical protein